MCLCQPEDKVVTDIHGARERPAGKGCPIIGHPCDRFIIITKKVKTISRMLVLDDKKPVSNDKSIPRS